MTKVAVATLYRAPIVGWMVHDLQFGPPDAGYFFAANVVMLALFSVIWFGYAALVVLALTMTAIMLTLLVTITMQGILPRFDDRGALSDRH